MIVVSQALSASLGVEDIESVTYSMVADAPIAGTTIRQEYRVQIRNAGERLLNVSGTPLPAAASTAVISAPISFGDIDAGAFAQGESHLVIEHDCGASTGTVELAWRFDGVPGQGIPPDPGPEGELSLEGVDGDADGIRDDLERLIALEFPSEPAKRTALMLMAEKLQGTIAAGASSAAAHAYIAQLDAAATCLSLADPERGIALLIWLENRFMNTVPRLEAYLRFNAFFHGTRSTGSSPLDPSIACAALPPA